MELYVQILYCYYIKTKFLTPNVWSKIKFVFNTPKTSNFYNLDNDLLKNFCINFFRVELDIIVTIIVKKRFVDCEIDDE